MSLLGLIPARGGSKGIPRKNLADLGGKPLIAWTIDAARSSRVLDQIVVSTDDEEIAEVSRELGASVPFLRPRKLASDEATSLSVVRHALDTLSEQGLLFEGVVLLQPTSPFRSALDIEMAAHSALDSASAGIVNVVSVTLHNHDPRWSFEINEVGRLQKLFGEVGPARRQNALKSYYPNGAVFVTSVANVMAGFDWYDGQVAPYIMPASRSMDIDTPWDLELARARVKSYPKPIDVGR